MVKKNPYVHYSNQNNVRGTTDILRYSQIYMNIALIRPKHGLHEEISAIRSHSVTKITTVNCLINR